MKRLLIIVGLVFLGAALVFLNQGLRKSAVPDKDEDEQAQQAKTPAAQKTTPTDPNAVLPPEETVGDPSTVRHRIKVGWVYNEANQQKPEMLAVPIQAIRDYARQSGGAVTAEIVDLDVPVEDRSPTARTVTSLGIQVDGRSLFGGNLSDVPAPQQMITSQLNAAMSKK